jgi:hypothetical protein
LKNVNPRKPAIRREAAITVKPVVVKRTQFVGKNICLWARKGNPGKWKVTGGADFNGIPKLLICN